MKAHKSMLDVLRNGIAAKLKNSPKKLPYRAWSVLKIRGFSLNNAFRNAGRGRVRVPAYDKWEVDILQKLLPLIMPPPPYELSIEFHVANPLNCDTDNMVKPLQDALSHAYGFRDIDVWSVHAKKARCEKGEEKILFMFDHYWHAQEEAYGTAPLKPKRRKTIAKGDAASTIPAN